MLSAHELEQRYSGRVAVSIDALTLDPGTVTAIVGPNGSGKSTLLRLLALVERPHRGELRLAGQPVVTARDQRTARRMVTLVEQQPLLFEMTVADNLAYALKLHGERLPEPRPRVLEALDRVGATPLADRAARELSGGETQRVALARAILLAPRVLLLDEPLSAADRSARGALADALARLQAEGVAVCLASHQLEDAYRWASRLLALADGRITPVAPENLFRTVVPAGAGPRMVRAGPLELMVVTDRSGPATIAIPADDVVVSRAPLDASVRNQFAGRVIAISDDGHGHVRLTADVGTELVARITPAALADLELSVGSPVVLAVKAMAVRVF